MLKKSKYLNEECDMEKKRYDVIMKKSSILIQLLTIMSLLCGAKAAGPSDEELEVILQFFEFDLEDICSSKSEAKWDFLRGNKTDLKQLLDLELREAELYKNETQALQEFFGKTFSNKRLQRLFDIFFYPGAPLVGVTELKEYKEFSVKLEELNRKMTVGCPKNDNSEADTNPSNTGEKKCVPKNSRTVNKILAQEKNERELKDLWTEWFEELEWQTRKTKFDFMQQLSILDIEAEQNEEDDLADYWLKQADVKDLDYHKISLLWKEILPLYQKLRTYIAKLIEQKYGSKVFINNNLFPMHLLGSLKPENWITAAEKLGAFANAKPYKSILSKLKEKNAEDLYKMADNFTADVKIGELPSEFYNNSNFKVTSQNCQSKVFDYCSRKNVFRAMSCSDEDVTINGFIKIHEEVAKLKHLIFAGKEFQDEENGFLFREGPRDSVIYEAASSLSSLIAVRPKNLRKQKLLPETTLPNEEIFSLLLSALHVIPALPYYLAADLWRINALKEIDATVEESTFEPSITSYHSSISTLSPDNDDEADDSKEIEKRDVSDEKMDSEENEKTESDNWEAEATTVETSSSGTMSKIRVTHAPIITPKVYDFDNLTADWWTYREQLQGVGNADGKLYPDFYQDEKIIWNKPYLSKFLGMILQFQLLEYFKQENFTTNTHKLQLLLRSGKSKPFREILVDLFEITEISSEPLMKYFKPLEDFLDAGGNFQDKNSDSDSDDFNLFSESYSMNTTPGNNGDTQKGSNTIAFSILILIVLGIIIVSLFVALRRYRRKQRAKERRKRLNEAIN